jgi:hypothetical protein
MIISTYQIDGPMFLKKHLQHYSPNKIMFPYNYLIEKYISLSSLIIRSKRYHS